MTIEETLQAQRTYFRSGKTLSAGFRTEMLRKLYDGIERYSDALSEALLADLGKSRYEGFMCEIGLTQSEISYLLRHVRRWMKGERVPTPLAQFAARSCRKPSPRGNVLIMSPWNYPVLLTLEPLADAIAAGCTAVLKPSAYSPASSEVLRKLIAEIYPPEYVAVTTGGRAENTALLEQKFDLIFFTGSQTVGKEVLRHAAEHLTPAVLELGGKSPCIVDRTAKLSLAAKRIVFGKFLNCGQTCVAPDYILCGRSIRDELVSELKRQITAQYGADPLTNENYGRMISRKHYDRVLGLIDPAKTVCGGTEDPETLRIAPTVLTDVEWTDPVMGQEIFGPVLPVLTYEDFDEIFDMLADRPKPLACYLFSGDRRHITAVQERLMYGGCCINDVIIHLATSGMPFGGVGESGMGCYHGKAGFDTFSHTKSTVSKATWIDLPMRYQPYDGGLNEKLTRFFLR